RAVLLLLGLRRRLLGLGRRVRAGPAAVLRLPVLLLLLGRAVHRLLRVPRLRGLRRLRGLPVLLLAVRGRLRRAAVARRAVLVLRGRVPGGRPVLPRGRLPVLRGLLLLRAAERRRRRRLLPVLRHRLLDHRGRRRGRRLPLLLTGFLPRLRRRRLTAQL